MIAFIEGLLIEKEPTRVIVSTGGIGYELFIPLSSFDRLPEIGRAVRMLTYQHVREDALLLYGFVTDEEKSMFLLLMNVSGIGPKLALTALSGLSVRELKQSVVQADVKRLSSISGIGKKTAERIVIELRDKLSKGESLEAVAGADELPVGNQRMRDAMLALISLGYKQADAQKMIHAVATVLQPDTPVEELVRKALAGT